MGREMEMESLSVSADAEKGMAEKQEMETKEERKLGGVKTMPFILGILLSLFC